MRLHIRVWASFKMVTGTGGRPSTGTMHQALHKAKQTYQEENETKELEARGQGPAAVLVEGRWEGRTSRGMESDEAALSSGKHPLR